jgi:hypothetical protein
MLTLYIADAERDVGMKNLSQKEAIALLRNLEDSLDSYCELNEEGKTAFRMAIEALSCSEIPNNSDTISRQAAIDAICEHGTDLERRGITVLAVVNHKQATVDLLENLPSVQPDIIRCKDCEYLCNEDGLRGMCWHINGFGTDIKDKYNSFCSWAERREDGH